MARDAFDWYYDGTDYLLIMGDEDLDPDEEILYDEEYYREIYDDDFIIEDFDDDYWD